VLVPYSLWSVDLPLQLHGAIARALVFYLAAVGVWGVVEGIRGRGPSGSYLGSLAVAVAVSVIQGALGFATFALRGAPREPMHILYGFALALALPLAWTYARGRPSARMSLFLGFAALFAAGLAIRGLTTA